MQLVSIKYLLQQYNKVIWKTVLKFVEILQQTFEYPCVLCEDCSTSLYTVNYSSNEGLSIFDIFHSVDLAVPCSHNDWLTLFENKHPKKVKKKKNKK